MDAVTSLNPIVFLLGAVAALLAVVWFLVPFALFGQKRRLDRIAAELVRTREALAAEQRRTNALLERMAGPPPAAEAPVLRAAEPPAAPAPRRRPLVATRD